jgi:hypothetical protein
LALTRSALTLEYVLVPVSATALGAPVNVTRDTVKMAFPATGVAPQSGDWKAADWETEPSYPKTYLARCLVGPGGAVTLTAATTYDVWVKVSDSPEVPARLVDTLVVT